MAEEAKITEQEIDRLYETLKKDAEAGGYNLNPDLELTKQLAQGLLINEKRHGYQACPCRLAMSKEADLDIICPCYYRDPDLAEYGTCYCSLYVSRAVLDGKKEAEPIPERRPPLKEREMAKPKKEIGGTLKPSLPVWRCRVCGYLAGREEPPEVCPICKAKKERFERFI